MAEEQTDDLAYWIERVTPENASDPESGAKAAKWAADRVRDELPAIKADIRIWPETRVGIRSEVARRVTKRARELRDDWLREHGAFVSG